MIDLGASLDPEDVIHCRITSVGPDDDGQLRGCRTGDAERRSGTMKFEWRPTLGFDW